MIDIENKTLNPQSAPKVGDLWAGQGGIYIGDILGDDQVLYGLIISEEMDIGMAEFGYKHKGDLSQWDGLSNTQTLRGKSPAADLAANYERDGYCDFYLPSRRELMVALANVPHLFNPEDCYWSSKTRGENHAWAVDFKYGGVLNYPQDFTLRVRPFRRFIK